MPWSTLERGDGVYIECPRVSKTRHSDRILPKHAVDYGYAVLGAQQSCTTGVCLGFGETDFTCTLCDVSYHILWSIHKVLVHGSIMERYFATLFYYLLYYLSRKWNIYAFMYFILRITENYIFYIYIFGKNNCAEIFKVLVKYRSENNFVVSSK